MSTADQLYIRMTGESRRDGIPGGPARAGSRFTHSSSFMRARDKENRWQQNLLTGDELAARLRTGPGTPLDLTTLVPGPAPALIQTFGMPAPLLAWVTTVISDTPLINVVEQSTWTPTGVAVADSAAGGPGSSATFNRRLLEAQRILSEMTVPAEALSDAGQAEMTVDTLLERDWARAVQNEIVSGNGSTYVLEGAGIGTHLTGVLGAALYTVAADPAFKLDGLAHAVRYVTGSGGFPGPHVVCAKSTTLERLFTVKDANYAYLERDIALPSVAAWIPVESVPDGTALVMDPREVILYIVGGFGITSSDDYTDVSSGLNYFSAGLLRLLGEARVACWIRNPGCAAVVTGL